MRQSTGKKSDPNIKALTGDWHYSGALEYEYWTERDCEAYRCDDYCRCGVLRDMKARSINPCAIADTIVGKMDNVIHAYCIDRVVMRAVTPYVSNPEDLFEISAVGGYYGEEIGTIKMVSHVADELGKKIRLLGDMKSNRARILFVLENEYGHVLPAIKKAKGWYVKDIDFCEIDVGQPDHYENLQPAVVDAYVNYDLPRAICLKKGHKYRLIDGYHRVAAFEKKRKGNITIITNKS